MKVGFFIIVICFIKYMFINSELIISDDEEMHTIDIIAEITLKNLKHNGWNNILFMGHLPDRLYHRLKDLPFTFAVTEIGSDDEQIEDVVPYNSNVIIISCANLEEFENALKKLITLPYWHPLANIILYYHASYRKEAIAKIFFIFWYYKAINVVIIQYDDSMKEMSISHFTPYISEDYKLTNVFGCWTAKKVGMSMENFETSFVCVTKCNNVSSYTKLRALHLGTCIGFDTETVSIENKERIQYLNIFEDKGKNLHGFTFFAYAFQMIPFFIIEERGNGNYTFHQRDGMIWTIMRKVLNFKIDLSPSIDGLKNGFKFEVQIPQIFSFAQRKVDLLLYPVYQQDLMVVEVDYAVPHMDSGLCILSHRARFETIMFDVNFLMKNISLIIEFLICLCCTWFVFFIYNTEQIGNVSLDQAGKDLVNTIKTALSIGLHNPPKRGSFRIFLTITMWSFFVINFSTQAAIISLFSVQKKEKEVDTFDDIIQKGYRIEGVTSPDVVLPDMETKFLIITSRIKSINNIFGCVKQMETDSRRFCLMDCSIGHYVVRNMLNKKGTQFLHLASEARIHSHYLNMILHKHSPLTENFNRYVMMLFEAGLIKKWMEYRYIDFKEEATTKPLGVDDLAGIFDCYIFLVGISFFVFVLEIMIGLISWAKRKCRNGIRFKNISIKSVFKSKVLITKNLGINRGGVETSTQTV